jgi:hypothetical protein
MNPKLKKRLRKLGYKVGNYKDFLKLSPKEWAEVQKRIKDNENRK